MYEYWVGFSLILNGRQQFPPSTLPTHISRILLILSNEKGVLRRQFGRATVENGFKRRPNRLSDNLSRFSFDVNIEPPYFAVV